MSKFSQQLKGKRVTRTLHLDTYKFTIETNKSYIFAFKGRSKLFIVQKVAANKKACK